MRLVHIHVHRTAGTSVQRTLRDWLPRQVTLCYPDEELLEEPNVQAAWIGHLPLSSAPQAEFRSTIIRDPAERVFAHYHFWRDAPLRCSHPLYRRLHDEKLEVLDFAEAARGWQSRYIQDLDSYDVVGTYSPAGLTSFLRQLAAVLNLPPARPHHVSAFNHRHTLDDRLRRQLQDVDPLDQELYRDALKRTKRGDGASFFSLATTTR